MRAIKIVIAQLHLNYADTAERVDPLVRAAMALDSFSTLPVDSADYIGAMQARRREIYEFQKELRQIPTADPITYLGQVYSLIGIDYEGPRTTFLQGLRARLASRRRVSAGSPAVIRP